MFHPWMQPALWQITGSSYQDSFGEDHGKHQTYFWGVDNCFAQDRSRSQQQTASPNNSPDQRTYSRSFFNWSTFVCSSLSYMYIQAYLPCASMDIVPEHCQSFLEETVHWIYYCFYQQVHWIYCFYQQIQQMALSVKELADQRHRCSKGGWDAAD